MILLSASLLVLICCERLLRVPAGLFVCLCVCSSGRLLGFSCLVCFCLLLCLSGLSFPFACVPLCLSVSGVFVYVLPGLLVVSALFVCLVSLCTGPPPKAGGGGEAVREAGGHASGRVPR